MHLFTRRASRSSFADYLSAYENLGLAALPHLRSLRVSGRLRVSDLTAILNECVRAAHPALEVIVFEAIMTLLRKHPEHWPFFCVAVQTLPSRIKVVELLLCPGKQSERVKLREFKASLEQRSEDIGSLAAQGLLSVQEQYCMSACPFPSIWLLIND